MANEGFNGSTLSFAGSIVGPLVSIDYQETAAAIDVTGNTDALHNYVAGIPDITITCEVVGVTTLVIGDLGILDVNWFDDETDDVTSVVLVDVGRGGSLDDKLSSNLTFRPSSAIGSSV